MPRSLTKIFAKLDQELANDGDIFLGKGDVAYRVRDLEERRKNAALSGQHRQTQRYDTELMILKSAMGLPVNRLKEGEAAEIDTARNPKKGTTKDDISGDNLETSSTSTDAAWAKRVTLKGFATIYKRLHEAGYSYASEKRDGIDFHTWKGFRGRQQEEITLAMLGRHWLASASRNQHRFDGFNFNRSEH